MLGRRDTGDRLMRYVAVSAASAQNPEDRFTIKKHTSKALDNNAV